MNLEEKRTPPADIESLRNNETNSLTRLERLNEIENQYDCCVNGATTDKRILNFTAKCMVLFSILIFSFVMISKQDENSSIYINIILIIMSIWIPSPKISSQKQ